MSDFESALESELHRILDPLRTGPAPARRATAASGGSIKKLLGGAGAALGIKIVTGFAVAAAAATIAAAATEVAIKGSVNPVNWGQEGAHHTASLARQHEVKVSDSQAKQHNPANSNANNSGNGNSNGNDTSKSDGQGSDGNSNSKPKPTSESEPTDTPVRVLVPIQPQP